MSRQTQNLYSTDEYIQKNPTLHEEDSNWKITKILPYVDLIFADGFKPISCLTLLDIGGGAGTIMNGVSSYINSKFKARVRKIALDLSPGMLKVQIKNNPDISKALTEDICHTSLADKEADIALMIDVLEHVPEPVKALKELKRISKYAIFKVPLESNLRANIENKLSHGRTKLSSKEKWGHINFYSTFTILQQVKEYIGEVLAYSFTNSSEYGLYANKPNLKTKFSYSIGMLLHGMSPKLCSLVLGDFIMILVKCNSVV
jgi:ubiquinone/menaquinone biosynthesis C-methylase UbiE